MTGFFSYPQLHPFQGDFALVVFRTGAQSLLRNWIDRLESFDTLITVVALSWPGRLIRFKLDSKAGFGQEKQQPKCNNQHSTDKFSGRRSRSTETKG